MSRRIAHRARYRNMRHFTLFSPRSRHDFFSIRWAYRLQTLPYEKRPLGYGLSLIPIDFRLVRSAYV
jgi:hypothetical protein